VDDLLTDFIAETRETLEALAGEIVAWEADPADKARLDAIFRFVHTVKGSCGFLDLPRLGNLSHAAEDCLAEVRSGERTPDAALVSAVLAIIDRIGELTDALEANETLPEGEDEFLIAALAPGHAAAPAVENSGPVGKISVMPAAPPTRTVSRSIRLPVELLDRMMAGVSDMVLARNELSRLLRASGSNSATDVAFERLSLCVGEMRDAITRTRMARIEALFSALPRMVRDLSTELGKSVKLEVDGGDVELDREMIEMIRDPLTHIVRNALDHGIETPEERKTAGKPEIGRLRIGARQSANQILIEVSDDGRGIDADRVVRKAINAGVVTAEQAAAMSWSHKLDLIFEPGLSTAEQVTGVSGRGVGMDVVRANIERIGGTVDIESNPGQGLRLSLRVPLTLTIIPALTVSAKGTLFAIPRSAIDELVRPKGDQVRIERIGGEQVVFIRGVRLPVVNLGRFMGLTEDAEPGLLVVLRAGGGERYALGVEAVHDHEELVVKPAAPALMASGIYAGTTLPDNSRPMLLLDVAGIAAAANVRRDQSVAEEEEAPVQKRKVDAALPTLMFRDLDGVVRGVRLALVERIEDVATDCVMETSGVQMLPLQVRLTKLHSVSALPAHERLRLLRLSDGQNVMAYAIDQVIDVVEMRAELAPAPVAGPIAGVVLHEGNPIEMLDPFWLFTHAATASANDDAPLCLVADAEDPWAREVLAPLLGAAGYRVLFAGEPNEDRVSVVVTSTNRSPEGVDAPVVRLRGTPDNIGDESIYRYDRDGLLKALRRHVAGGK
jgi:two-component system, chemotaxis family, sensor kinase CheA